MGKYLTKDEMILLYNDTKEKLIAAGCDTFVGLSEEMYEEFRKEDGSVTCEHSTKGQYLDLKMTFLSLMSQIDPHPSIGYWQVFWCHTCVSHHDDHPFHCEIVRAR